MNSLYTITVRATSILVSPGQEASKLLQLLLDQFHFEDEFEEAENVLGYIYDLDTDILYLNKGVDVHYVKRLLGDATILFDEYDEYNQMKFEWEEIVSPRNDEQIDVIDFISGNNSHNYNIDKSQIFVSESTGFGKTFCAGYATGQLGMKTLIIMHRDALRGQWFESLLKMNGFPKKRIYEITDANEVHKIIQGDLKLNHDVYLMTHATFRATLRRVSNLKEMGKLSSNLKIGFKVIDEAHLEFRNTILIDMCLNVKRNLYLTATAGRSQKEENIIFKHVFNYAEFYKRPDIPQQKWVEYNIIQINTNVPPAIYKYRIAGGRGMNLGNYGKWVIQRDKKRTHFNVCLELVKQIFQEYDKSKILIFMPLIDLCVDLQHFLNTSLSIDKDFDYDPTIGTIHSHNSKSDNERNKKCDIIVTTIASCGTGTDIPGITGIINCCPFNSGITANQVFGRIRYCGRICQFYDIIDSSVLMDQIWWRNRFKAIKNRALNVKSLIWE